MRLYQATIIMKNLVLSICILFTVISFAQQKKYTEIKGKIIVELNDVEGITIYNSTANKGTITNALGEFVIQVELNDSVEIRALQYQNFDIVINQSIINSKTMQVFLLEQINKLEEIVVKSNNLSGFLNKDVITFTPKSNAIYFVYKNDGDFNTNEPSKNVDNTVLHYQGQTMQNGLNIINVVDQLLIPLFRAKIEDKEKKGIPEVPVKSIKYYFGSQFLVNNFRIPEYRVEEFIRYVESENFDFALLNYGNELKLLEIINAKSKTFLETNN